MEKKIFLLIFLFLYLITSKVHSEDFFSFKNIKVGMKGYAKSVFKGTKIETFPITVLGVLKGGARGHNFILISIDGGYCFINKTGIISGMSGSPVYIKGKLAGAIAFSWNYSKEAIGGVTPIEDMLNFSPLKGKTFSKKEDPLVYNLPKKLKIKQNFYKKVYFLATHKFNPKSFPKDALVLSPSTSLLMVDGFSNHSLERLRKVLEPLGVEVVMGGGNLTSYKNNFSSILAPGSAIGVQYVRGDLNIVNSGTLTYRKGDKILGMGHSIFNLGEVEFPLTLNYVYGIVPTYDASFRLSSPIKVIGKFDRDFSTGISGQLNKFAKMIPVKIEINDFLRKTKRLYNLEVIENQALTPIFLNQALMETFSTNGFSLGEGSARVSYHFDFEKYPPLDYKELIFNFLSLENELDKQFYKIFNPLINNEFEKLKIKHIAVNLEIIKKNLTAKIEKVSVDKDQVKPGDELNLQIALKPYNGKVSNKEVKFQIPFNLKKGWVKLAVSGGTDYDELRKNLFLEKPKIFEVSQILKNLTYSEKQNDLIVKLVLPRDDIIIKGERLTHLPNFFRNILDSLPTTLVDYDKETYTEIIKTPWVVSGWKVINLEIKEDSKDNKVSSNLDIFFTSSKAASPGKGKSEEEKQTENIFESKSLVLNSLTDFLEGDFIGTSINEYGMLSLAPKDEVIFTLKEGFINNVVSDLKSNLIYFSDFEGKIYKIDSQGRFKDFIKLPELIISALKIDSKGNLLALTLPNGKFYKITPQGEIAFSHQFKENYLWSLVLDSNDNIFIGTGLPGKIYKINSKELISLFCDLKEEHINNLIFDSSGNLYAATSDRAVIYKVNSQGEFEAVFSALPDNIETMLLDKEDLYISADGNIYKLNLISKKTKKFKFYNKLNLSLTKVKDGILVGSFQKGKLYKILKNEELIRLYDFKATGVIGILPFGEDLLVATLNPNKLIKIKSKFSQEGLFFSDILDLGIESKFGNISFNTSEEKNTNVILQTRSGNTPLIDSSWSDWSREYINKQGEKIASPQARFLQIKAKLTTLDENKTPTLYQIKFFYKNLKFPSHLKFINPDGINIFKDKINLKWEVQDANLDNLAFDLYYKKKGELNWEPIILNLKAKFKKEAREKKSELYQEEFLWETMKVPDGEYYLKLIGYDYTDENDQSLKFQIISKPLIICNTPPELKDILVSLENNELIIKGKAKSKLLNIKSVFFKINNQDEISALAVDGLWDSNEEDFLIKFKFKEKSNFVKVYAEDEAGNESAWDKKF